MHYEFDQLLEELGDGRLDEDGRRRLDALCAADPRLAARYRQERNLTGLLSRCGPNHAPVDLTRSVMAHLETRIRVRPLRPWYWWVMEPAFRTAFAAVVLVAVGVEIGLLVANKKGTQIASAPLSGTPMTFTINTLPEVPTDDNLPAKPAVARPKPVTPKAVKSSGERTIAMGARPARTPAPAAQPNWQLEPLPTPAPAHPGQALPGNMAEFPNSNPLAGGAAVVPTPAPTSPPQPQFPAVPPSETQLAKTNPAGQKQQDAPRSMSEREVAMTITLNPNALPLPSAADSERPATALPDGARSFQPSGAKAKRESLTAKDVEIALFAAAPEAKDVTSGPVPGETNKWQVLAKLTPVQFRKFHAELRTIGIEPAPALKENNPEAARELRNEPTSNTRNRYDITRGLQWYKLQNARVTMVSPATQPAGTTSTVKAAPERTEDGAAEKLEVKIIIEQVDGLFSTR